MGKKSIRNGETCDCFHVESMEGEEEASSVYFKVRMRVRAFNE